MTNPEPRIDLFPFCLMDIRAGQNERRW